MAVVGVVKAIITADTTQFKKGMTDAQRSMDQLGKNMSKAGKSMTMKVTMPLVGLGVAAAKMASDFEFSMTQIETLVGRSASEVETLKGAVLGLSGETGRAPKELADAMFFITSAGLDAASATAALEMSAKAAAVGLGDTSVVADAVTNAMNGYGMAADGAAFATDVLAKTVEQGKASAADLAPQFGRLIPMAAELGISFDQVGAGLAFLTRSSGDAALSATQLGGVMKSILKPSQQALKTFNEIGVDLDGLRAAASEDLLGALQDLRVSLEANGKEMGDVFEDIRGLNGALMLTGEASAQARDVFDELADSSGKLDEAFLGVQKTAQFKLSVAMSSMKASMITLGEQVLPVVVPMIASLAGWIGSLATAFGNMAGPAQTVVVILGVVLAAAGPVLMILGSLVSALGTLGITAGAATVPVAATSAAVGTLGATAGVATVSLGALLLPIAAIAAAGVGLFVFFSRMGAQAKEARERADELTEAMILQGNKAPLLGTELDTLIEKYNSLKVEVEEATESINDFAGESVLVGLALERGVAPAIDNLQTQFPALNSLIASGTSAFSLYQDANMGVRASTDSVTTALRNADPAIRDITSALADKIDADQMSVAEAKNVLRVLDQTSTAYRTSTDETMADNRAIIESTEKRKEWAEIVGGPAVAAVLALAERTGDYNLALATVNRMIDHHVGEQERAIAAADELEAAQAGVVSMLVDTTAAFEEERAAASGANLSFTERQQVVAVAHRHNQMLVASSQDLQTNLNAEAVAASEVAQAYADMGDAKLYSQGADFKAGREAAREAIYRREAAAAAVVQAEAEAQAVKDAEDLADFLQDQVNNLERFNQIAADVTGELEGQADAIRQQADAGEFTYEQAVKNLKVAIKAAKTEEDRIQAIEDAAKAAKDAAREQRDSAIAQIRAERSLEAAKRNQLRLIEDINDTRRDLVRLAAEQLDIESDSGDWAVRYARDLANAELSVMGITERIRELEATQGGVSGVAGARDAVTMLSLLGSVVTDVEQALIDMGLISIGDAQIADISARDAKSLVDLEKRLTKVRQEMEEGEATQLDLLAAMESYDDALRDVTRESRALQDAREALSRAEVDAIKLEEEQARVAFQLEVAYVDLAEAQLHLTDIGDKEATQSKALAELAERQAAADRQLADQKRDLEDSILDVTVAGYALTDAEERAAEAGAEVNAVIANQTALFSDLETGVGDFTAEVSSLRDEWEKLQKLMEDKDKKGGGGGATDPTGGWFAQPTDPKSISKEMALTLLGTEGVDLSGFAKAGPWSIPSAQTGGFVKSAGLVNVHAGETITPAGGGGVNITVNVEGSVSSERELVESIRKGLLQAQKSGKAVVL